MKKLIEFVNALRRGEEAQMSITLEWYDLVTVALVVGLIVMLLIKV